jgi:hypothetical protein
VGVEDVADERVDRDGELDLRAAPVEWVGTTLGDGLRKTAITRGGYNFYQFKESRTVGSSSTSKICPTSR